MIDINYNFFILVLGEWIEHYSFKKFVDYSFIRYDNNRKSKNENGEEFLYNARKNLKINLSIKERVLYDYSYTGWLINDNAHRDFRFDLVQLLLNNILGKHTFVNGFHNRKFASTTKVILAKDVKRDEHVIFVGMSLFTTTLAKYLTKNEMKKLRELEQDLVKIISTKTAIDKRILALNLNKNDIVNCNYLDIKSIEEERNFGDKKYLFFDKKTDEEIEVFDFVQ